MNRVAWRNTILMVFLLLATTISYASNMGALGRGGFDAHDPSSRSMRNVDKNYDRGKTIVMGRFQELGPLKFCVLTEDESKQVKLKRKTLKPYHGVTTNKLVHSLYNCENPEELMFDRVGRLLMSDVIYYLNRRYKLQLTEYSASVLSPYADINK